MTRFSLFLLLCFLGCADKIFLVVSLKAPPGTVAPNVDRLEVTISAEVEGAPVQKVVAFDVTNQSLPLSFFLSNEADQQGLEVSLSVSGTLDGVLVLQATGTGLLGEEVDLTALFCGDTVLQAEIGEECDDGNRENSDACEADCSLPFCGNGLTDPGEQCDDGNAEDSDECTNACLTVICGDGLLQLNEECDDNNLSDADGCEADCTLPACGNGIIDPGELCYETPILLPTANTPVDVELGDLNNDGLLDLAVAQSGAGVVSITLFQNQGGGQFLGVNMPPVNSPQRSLQLADFNADNRLDIGVTTNGDQFFVLQQDAAGAFQSNSFAAALTNTSLVVGDFAKTGNGLVDVIMLPAAIPNSFRFLKNSTVAFLDFDPLQTISLQGGNAFDLLGGDFNQDAQDELDLLSVMFISSQLQLKFFAGNGTGGFAPPILKVVATSTTQPPVGPNQAATLDIDGDSLLDVALINPSQSTIEVLLGDTTNLFDPSVAVALGFVPTSVALADLNADGTAELLVTNQTQLVIFPGLGGAQFGAGVVVNGGVLPVAPAAADLNEDGVVDLVLAEKGGDKLRVFLANP